MGFSRELHDFADGFRHGVELGTNQSEAERLAQESKNRYGRAPGDDGGATVPTSGGGASIPHVGGDGDKTSSTSNGGSEFAQNAYKFYRGKGLSHAHAAGIVGNLMGESGGDPNVLNGVRAGDSGRSFYAAQWNGKRLDNLLAYAKSNHPDSPQPTTDDQLGFVLQESDPKSPYYDPQAGTAYKLAAQAKTPEEATDAYMTHYERPKDRSSFNARVKYATSLTDSGDVTAPVASTTKPAAASPDDTSSTKSDTGGQDKPEEQKAADNNAIPVPDAPQEQLASWEQFAPDEDLFRQQQQMQVPTMFAARGGVIPEPVQSFDGGGLPVVNPDNPSAVNGVDKYSPTRAYTQPIAATSGTATTPRRISFPTTTGSGGDNTATDWRSWGDGSPSQLALRKGIADRAAANAVKPAAAAPVAAAPVAKPQAAPALTWMPGGNRQGGYWAQMPTTANLSKYGMKGSNPLTRYARGGAVRDQRFQEFLRQESQGGRSSRDDGGESARDRAARRLSAEENRPSSTAYRPSQDKKYFEPADAPRRKPGKIKKSDGDKTGSTKKAIDEPEIQEDRATRFRESELVPGPSSVREGRDVVPEEDRATRFRESELVPGPSSTRGLPEQGPPIPAVPTPGVSPVPSPPADPGATLPSGVPVPKKVTGGGVDRPDEPPIFALKRRDQDKIAAARQRRAILDKFPNAKIGGTVAPPAPSAIPAPDDFSADTSSTPPAPLPTPPPVPAANNLVPVLLDPVTGQLIPANSDDPGGAAMGEPNPVRFGYAQGGVIPEPGEPGYNEAVASGATAQAEPQAEPQKANVRATPQLVSDVRKAVDGGVRFLQKHFGIGGEGAVPTPTDGATTDDGIRRFATGEGAADPQELAGIDQHVDPTGELDEGHRQMARLAQTMNWYQSRGRKEEAGAAAGSLMQYGAQRFSKLGSMSQAAYEQYLQDGDSTHLDASMKYLEKAYEMIPDGAQVNIRLNDKTGKLEAQHTDDQGDTTFMAIEPQELPGLLKQVQDKSLYWNSIYRLADPQGAQNKDIEERQVAAEQRSNKSELAKEGRAGAAEAAKNARELGEKQAEHAQTQAEKAAEHKQAQEEEKAKEGRANTEEERRALRNASIARAQKMAETRKDVNWDAVNPILGEVSDANSSKDQVQIDTAMSKLWDALPEVGREKTFRDLTGQGATDFKHVPTQDPSKPPADFPTAQRMKDPKTGEPIWAVKGADGKWSRVVSG